MTQLWIVGQYRQWTAAGSVWDIQGVFDDEERARAACLNSSYFVAPLTLNEPLPDVRVGWPGVVYPLEDQRPWGPTLTAVGPLNSVGEDLPEPDDGQHAIRPGN